MYYIYQHISITNEVFFIGRGTISDSHSYKDYNRAYSKTNRSKEWYIIAKNGFSVQIRDFYKCSKSLIYMTLNNITKTSLNYVWKYK